MISFVFSFAYLLCIPLFWCVHYGETGSSPAGRCDCGGDEICIVETKAGRLSGEVFAAAEKKKECKWLSKVYTLLKIFFALKVLFWVYDRLKV